MNKLKSFASEILNTNNLTQIKYETHINEPKEVSFQTTEKYFRELLENVQLIAVLLNEQGSVIYCNPYLLSITGYTNEEMIGCDWFVRMIPVTNPETKKEFSKSIDTENIAGHYEKPIITKKGETLTINWSNTLLRNPSGSVIGTACIGEDITERKLLRSQLTESEEKFRTIFENVQDVFYQIDLNGIVLNISPSIKSFSGFSREEIVDTPFANLFYYQEDKEILLNTIIKNAELRDYELILKTKTGKMIYISINARLIYGNNGSPNHIDGTIKNITEQKQAEKQVILLCRAVEQSPIMVIITNRKGDIVYVNSRFIEVTGYTMAEIKGSPPRFLQSGDHSKEFYKALWDTILSGNDWHGELHSKKKNGELYWVNVVISSVLNSKGNISYFVAVEENITEKIENMKELKSAKEKAQESDRLKTVFLQNMSHEIRTPMNAIMGFSDLLTDNFNNKAKLQDFTNIIKQRSSDLLDLINEILDLSKIETGQLPINIEECDLMNLFKEMQLFFINHSQKIDKTHIDLQFTTVCDPLKMLIRTDKGKLKQIFINLIYNAFKFTDKGKITFGCTNNINNNLIFFVSDTGIGIPEDKQAVIFERFMQLNLENNTAMGGTGLGLSIVKGLIELLGGEIILKSIVGNGSTFYFSLPYQIVESTEVKTNTTKSETKIDLKNYTILIVEDEIYNTEYLKEVLIDTEINIMTANNGQKAIELVESGITIDILLMDIKMPGMSGIEATTIIKKIKPQIKIIAQTAYATSNDKLNAINAGCDNYISKPINKQLLLNMINEHINPGK